MVSEKIENLLKSDSSNDTLLYYSGVNLLKLEKYHEAVGYFQNVISNPASEFFQDAEYRLGFCLLLKGESKEAEQIFSEILKDSSNTYRESAIRLKE